MFKARSFKIGGTVQIKPEQFESTGLPDSARGPLKVWEYAPNHGSEFQYMLANAQEDLFIVQEHVLFEIAP